MSVQVLDRQAIASRDAKHQKESPLSMAGKVAVISGSSSGIGKAVAIELASRGASVVLNYPSASVKSEAEEVCHQSRGKSIAVCADMGSTNGPGELIQAAVDEFGTVDIVVNNAALAVNKPLEEHTLQDWDTLVSINGRGTFLLTQAALPFLSRPGGRIINVCSTSSRAAPPLQTIYAGTKGMVGQFHSVLGPKSCHPSTDVPSMPSVQALP